MINWLFVKDVLIKSFLDECAEKTHMHEHKNTQITRCSQEKHLCPSTENKLKSANEIRKFNFILQKKVMIEKIQGLLLDLY